MNFPSGKTAKILVVDDRAINRECLSTLLGYAGYGVVEAADGAEALAAARAAPPDLVITDVLMPGMDGCELFKRCKADASLADIPIVFYTAAFRLEELTSLAARHDNAIVLAKPSDPKAILAAVAQALDQKAAATPLPTRAAPANGAFSDGQALGLRLATLLELCLALAGERHPEKLLKLACRGARDILNVPYAAVGLVDEAGRLQHLETAGLADSARSALGTSPSDAKFLSAFHPPAATVLTQAIQSPSLCYGWIYLAGGSFLAAESEQIAANLAAQLALAWENLHCQHLIANRERRLTGMIESAMDAIITIDEKQCIHLFNSAAETMFGYPREAMLGQPLDRLVPERFRAAHATYVEQFGLSGRKKKGAMAGFSGLRADGTEFPVEAAISTLREDGIRLHTVILRDITERQAAEAALQQAHDELEERVLERTLALQEANRALRIEVEEHLRTEAELRRSNNELEQMAYIVTHDLQEPLRTVNSFVQLLGQRYRGRLDEEADRFIDFAVEGVSRMRDLVQDVLEFARIDGAQTPGAKPADTAAAFDVALANLQGSIQETSAAIRCDPLPPVTVDRQQLSLLFQNLLGNALKFRGAATPHIRVSVAQEGKDWRFCVRDNGIGIAPAYHERIFAIFQRLHARSEFPGTGIGLALCKKIVERHGGRIWVESAPGEGASFLFTLPGAALEAGADDRRRHSAGP